MFRKMPFLLLALMGFIGAFHSWIPYEVQSILYGVSLTIKSAMVFCLPLIIFGLLFKTAVGFAKSASKIILFLIAAICLSNFISTMISYSVGRIAYGFDLTMSFPSEGAQLQPFWSWALPKWLGNDTAMLAGLGLGILLGLWRPSWAAKVSAKIDRIIGVLLKGCLYVIPIFIAGFFMKMCHDKVIGYILQNYGLIFGLVAFFVFAYIAFLYRVATHGSDKTFIQSVKNMLPAAMAGFGSMSSAAAMPLTILGVEKNAKDPELASSIVPATVNVHLIGDCFAIPIFAFAVLKSFGVPEPDFINYVIFACYFVLAKFSVAAVPGGGILVMLPILERYLGFDGTMLSLITALYILFDPVITCANVLGNGGFAMNLSRWIKVRKLDKSGENTFLSP
ncbi:MAG: cation:dicarboxylase symporter family transporter [Chlamydiales bacterium]|nr:cation:dicarboxylase symporter family transporter [Chlamydiales bacterium]